MSLSKEILEGTDEKVKAYLATGAPVNVIDEYGYTPLIHATVLNKTELVALLLKYHADPNITDITGSTALHWAVDNNHLAISRLLLHARADPNAYTAHGQPVLFYPLLRKNKPLIQLLLSKGANIDFANDFILAKLVAHRFELQGHSDLVNPDGLFIAVDLEGFYLEFTLDLVQDSLNRFIHSYVARRQDLHENALQQIIVSLANAVKLRAFKHFNVDEKQHLTTIRQLLQCRPLLLPVSYRGHAITFAQHGDLLAICDRGVHKMTDPIVIYRITKAHHLSEAFYTDLLYARQTDQSIKHALPERLGLVSVAKLPIKHQITGNCSWANVEASVPSMLYLLLGASIGNNPNGLTTLVNKIMLFYRTWLEWDKDRALEDWLTDFDKFSFSRQRSRAALLGSVLFQACDLQRETDLKRAKMILSLLSRPPFRYIVRAYLLEGPQFRKKIEQCGYKLSDFDQ